jgi:Ca2+-binding RTX toxin-like protein
MSASLTRCVVLAVCVGALAAPGPARAAISAGFTIPPDGLNPVLGIEVTDPSSDVTVTPDAFANTQVTATNPITPGFGCSVGASPTVVNCAQPAPGMMGLTYTGGAGDDTLTLTGGFGIDTTASGGAGNDTITTDNAPDRLSGDDGNDTLSGGGGSDIIDGGPGNDTISGGDLGDMLTGGPGSDALDGGPGDDMIDTVDGEVDGPIDCGLGPDLLFADNFLDALDFASCETIAPEFGPGDPRILPDDAVQGRTLTAVATPSGTASSVSLQWLRCGPTGDLATCDVIPGANFANYQLAAPDVGHTIRVGAEASNAAGSDARASAPTAVVRGLPAAVPAPVRPPAAPAPAAPRLVPLSGRVAAIRCGGRTCRLTLALAGPVARVRVDLRRGARRLARVTRRVRTPTLRVTLRARRPLARGRYTVAVRLSAADGRTRSFRRVVRVR